MRNIIAAALSMMALVSTLMTGCSGGGGGSIGADAGPGAAPAAAKMVTGVAATGAPINGSVYLTDSSAPSRKLTARTASDGSYAFNVENLTPPYIIKATYSDAKGEHNLYSLASDAGITNVTPLTTIIVAQAVASTDLDAFYSNHTAPDLAAAATKVPAALKDLQTALSPLMAQFGAKDFDVLHGSFDANHTGIDAMMDTVTVAVNNNAVSITTKADNAPVFTAPAQNIVAGTLTMPTDQAPVATAPSSGSALYTSNCAGCHGDIASSNLIGRVSVGITQTAITSNLGGMKFLSSLNSTDLQNIVDALTVSAPAPGPATPAPSIPGGTTSIDGPALYAANCAACHGTLASSRKTGTTVVRTQNAISGKIGGMGSLASLTAAEIQAIVTALNPTGSTPAPVPSPSPSPAPAPTPAPTPAPVIDGATEYATSCAGCHQPLATSTKQGTTATRLDSAISANAGGMGFLSSLTAAVKQAIVAVLNLGAPVPAPAPTPTPAPVPVPAPDGAALYAANCAGCHGALASSNKKGMTLARLDAGITNNAGGMSYLSGLSVAERQAIVTALAVVTPAPTPVPTPAPVPAPAADGAALYAANCAGCHGALASSSKKGITIARLQTSIANNVGGMGPLSRLTVSEVQAIVTALTPATPTPIPTPTPTPTPVPAPDGAALYAANCAGCHGALATSGKAGASAARIQAAITGNVGNMGYLSTLSSAQVTAITTALATVKPAPVPTPTPTPVPAADGAALYASNCAGCHGPLATSGKAGATVARTQAAITGNVGNMGYLSTLTSSQLTAIASALATVKPSPTPAPAPTCGSCHALPPATGHHSKHRSRTCATCHGTGYSTTTVNAATHNNGIKNLVTTIGWNATSRSCSNSCHGTEKW